jgi:hypothetical protein
MLPYPLGISVVPIDTLECRSGPGSLLRQGLLIGSKARSRLGHCCDLLGR